MSDNIPHRVYVSGPLTVGATADSEIVAANCRTAIKVGREIHQRGHFCFVPHAYNAAMFETYAAWLALDFSIIQFWSTAVYRIPGKSVGADRELAYARGLGRLIWHRMEDVPVVKLR